MLSTPRVYNSNIIYLVYLNIELLLYFMNFQVHFNFMHFCGTGLNLGSCISRHLLCTELHFHKSHFQQLSLQPGNTSTSHKNYMSLFSTLFQRFLLISPRKILLKKMIRRAVLMYLSIIEITNLYFIYSFQISSYIFFVSQFT